MSWQIKVHALFHLLFDVLRVVLGQVIEFGVNDLLLVETVDVSVVSDGVHREVKLHRVRNWLEGIFCDESVRVELLVDLLRFGSCQSE